jgi:hypothetical protein
LSLVRVLCKMDTISVNVKYNSPSTIPFFITIVIIKEGRAKKTGVLKMGRSLVSTGVKRATGTGPCRCGTIAR